MKNNDLVQMQTDSTIIDGNNYILLELYIVLRCVCWFRLVF